MIPEQVTKDLKSTYENTLDYLRNQLAQINVGRANPGAIEDLEIDAGQYKAKLQELASIRSIETQTLLVEPWDKKLVGAIEKAIMGANLNLSVQSQEGGLYVKFPELTQESRDKARKQVDEMREETRVKARKTREEKWQEVQSRFKEGEITEDEKYRIKELLDEQIKKINDQIDEIADNKIEQIQSI